MYNWRKLTPDQRELVIAERQRRSYPWHRPPHFASAGNHLISAACYEHRHYIGSSVQRMIDFEQELLSVALTQSDQIYAWCVLPNHYHFLVHSENVKALTREIGQLHGRISYQWNGEENIRGRKVWHACTDRKMRSEEHFWATMNYVHHNPVRHGYVLQWREWPFSSAANMIREYGREELIRLWQDFPLMDYGKGWDDPDM